MELMLVPQDDWKEAFTVLSSIESLHLAYSGYRCNLGRKQEIPEMRLNKTFSLPDSISGAGGPGYERAGGRAGSLLGRVYISPNGRARWPTIHQGASFPFPPQAGVTAADYEFLAPPRRVGLVKAAGEGIAAAAAVSGGHGGASVVHR
ncbi:hypothetical protein OTU49_011320 [Cherax quadricarinatus]|uniref:Uncharacterized protein n=1 Tax=Cherax quadricarinatus TaxID=27406 RepID=A0AAW0W5U0_CHEQU